MFELPFTDFYSEEARAFYEIHKHESLPKLLLKFGNDVQKKAFSLQLESRRRAQHKLPTWLYCPQIVLPPKLNLEQASSEITAKYKAQLFRFDTSADLTGGSGIDSWQFSQKAKKHVYVEPDTDLLALAKYNLSALERNNVSFFSGTAEEFMAQNHQKFDLIFVDPSRRKEDGKKAIALEDYSPNVVEMQNSLLRVAENVLIKVSPFADIAYLKNCFSEHLAAIHVVAVENECKEILLHLKNEGSGAVAITTLNFGKQTQRKFTFTSEEEKTPAQFASALKNYLYEPNAAVLNAGAFNVLSTRFRLEKLQQNSHLYTSDQFLDDFPGTIYEVLETANPYKLNRSYEAVSIATRNYPEKPEAIRKRLKVSDGDAYKLFASTLGSKKIFIVTRKLAAQHG